jgi:hypothetical protein
VVGTVEDVGALVFLNEIPCQPSPATGFNVNGRF